MYELSSPVITSARLIPYAKRPKQAAHFTTAFSYEAPAGEAAARLGSMHVVIEVLSSGRIAEEVAELIIETGGNEYFNKPLDLDRPVVDHLERAIKSVNSELSQFIDKGNTSWLGKISAVIAVVVGDELHLTQTGAAEAYLYRGRKSLRITEGAVRQGPQPNKIFGSIATGTLAPGDKLLLASPALFHALSLLKLKEIILDNHPSVTVSKLKEELGREGVERVAAITAEITTPENAALQVRPNIPDEVQVLPPEHPIETAKAVAAPITQTAISSGQRLGNAARTNYQTTTPKLAAVRKRSVDSLRSLKGNHRALKIGAGAGAALLIMGIIVISHARSEAELAQLEALYASYAQEIKKADGVAEGNRPKAVAQLTKLKEDLDRLSEEKRVADLNKRLAANTGSGPASVKELSTLVSERLDTLQGVERVSTTTILSRASFSEGIPGKIYPYGKKLLLVASGSRPQVYEADLDTGKVSSSDADFTSIGEVVTTASATSAGTVLFGTKDGKVWVYSASEDSLEELKIGASHIGQATAIATYNSNLYILSGGKIYKHLRVFGGYGPEIAYADSTDAPALSGATGFGIDGAVYAAGPKGLAELSGGALKLAANLPSSLQHPASIRSLDDGEQLLLADLKSGRVGLLSRTETGFEASRQFILGGASKVADALITSKGALGYVLADGQLLSFPTKR